MVTLHNLLKNIGIAFLHNQKCWLIGTELFLLDRSNEEGVERHELDKKHIIDILGYGEKPILDDGSQYGYKTKIGSENILRGIEVKTTKADLKNGFIASGCNYHYLLTPVGVTKDFDIPKWVGIIEFNVDEFDANYSYADDRFYFKGLVLIKKPRYRGISDRNVNNMFTRIVKRSNRMMIMMISEKLDFWEML